MIQRTLPRQFARAMPRRQVMPTRAAHDVGPGYAYLPAPTYVQQRPLSCEYASAVIAMAHFGDWRSEWAFDEVVPLSPNPHWGYRGHINGAWGGADDYGVYAAPLVGPLAAFGYWSQPFYGAGSTTQLKALLTDGMPVLVWLGLFGDVSFHEYMHDTRYLLAPGMHVVVARGFDDAGVYVPDPANGAYKFFPWADFMWAGTSWMAWRWAWGRLEAEAVHSPGGAERLRVLAPSPALRRSGALSPRDKLPNCFPALAASHGGRP